MDIADLNAVDLNALVVFAQVVKQGSFVGAARRLNLPKATVSRRIQQLEDALQVKLLERSTRVVRPTDVGQLYFEYCDRITSEIIEANAVIDEQQREPTGLLRTSAPTAFTHLFLKSLIPQFLERYPKVRLSHKMVDRPVNPLQDGFDVSIRVGLLEDSRLRIQPLGKATLQLFASPVYLTQYGTAQNPAELTEHACIVTGSAHQTTWKLFSSKQETKEISLTPRCFINDPTLAYEWILTGMGIGLLPNFFCVKALQDKALVRLLPDWQAEPVPFNAIFPTTKARAPKVKVFLQFLEEALKHYNL
jgi:LysR family transcriptional regulator, regulator for bpeEF and oprC